MTVETVFTNAKVVTSDTVLHGSVRVTDGTITEISDEDSHVPGAIDLEGDYLLPGLVELHTDNLEKNFAPRPGVAWPGTAAAVAHDAQLAAGGITTVCDALCVGDLIARSKRLQHLDDMATAISDGQARNAFRAEHLLHLRCELSFVGVVDLFRGFIGNTMVRLVSLMDHTPGQRQFVSLEAYRRYFQGKYGMSDADMEDFVARQTEAHHKYSAKHRAILVEMSHANDWPIASHDDATVEHVETAKEDGAVVSEFPTTIEAAGAASDHGMGVLMGAPNLVLGGSHSGNVSALDLAQNGMLDILSSDYVPSSLIQGAFVLKNAKAGITLPDAVAKVSRTPVVAVWRAFWGSTTAARSRLAGETGRYGAGARGRRSADRRRGVARRVQDCLKETLDEPGGVLFAPLSARAITNRRAPPRGGIDEKNACPRDRCGNRRSGRVLFQPVRTGSGGSQDRLRQMGRRGSSRQLRHLDPWKSAGFDHLGIQVDDENELEEIEGRLRTAEAEVMEQRGAVCCYATSEKSWTYDPNGVAWETFVTHGEATEYGPDLRPVVAGAAE